MNLTVKLILLFYLLDIKNYKVLPFSSTKCSFETLSSSLYCLVAELPETGRKCAPAPAILKGAFSFLLCGTCCLQSFVFFVSTEQESGWRWELREPRGGKLQRTFTKEKILVAKYFSLIKLSEYQRQSHPHALF